MSLESGSRELASLRRARWLVSLTTPLLTHSVLAKSIFNPNFALFEPSSSGALTYQFNRLSAVNEHHLAFFKFVGVVLGESRSGSVLLVRA